jgi:hypothetical protein
MKRSLIFAALFCFSLGTSAAFAVGVNVSSPSNNYSGNAPIHVVANASSNYPISGWVVYVDGQTAYSAGWTGNIDTNVNMAQGSHQLVVRAWDAHGAWGDKWVNVTVTGGNGNGLPTPPGNAKVFSNLQQANTWGWCHDPGCAGGSGQGSYWMAKWQGSPSLSGGSTEFFNSGVWANALLWTKVGGGYNYARNFLMDYYLYVDDVSQWAAQAMEMEGFQFVDGWNYMMGMQCDVGTKLWDTWDQAAGRWYGTSIPCQAFSPWTWHHIQWYITTDTGSHTYTYRTLVVDGHSYPVNTTRRASYNGWNNNVGVQWQLDVNAKGAGYKEWVDKAKLTIW